VPDGSRCSGCLGRLVETVSALHGVSAVRVDEQAAAIVVEYDADLVGAVALTDAVERAGGTVAEAVTHESYRVTGLDCPDCAATLDASVEHVDDVLAASLNFASGILLVEYDPARDPRRGVEEAVRRMGYGISRLDADAGERGLLSRHRMGVQATVATILVAAGWSSSSTLSAASSSRARWRGRDAPSASSWRSLPNRLSSSVPVRRCWSLSKRSHPGRPSWCVPVSGSRSTGRSCTASRGSTRPS
jgi:copper chaperone CopZ